ncbi:MAG TPA: glycosyltransferase 87 family protein [Gaiellaceae bacterium]|nr:glycosyltransferase 87 family protein [Gaiellaceae bacterium]
MSPSPSASPDGRRLLGPLLAGSALFVASWSAISFVPAYSQWLFGDARFYENWGTWIAAHQLPYRDFRIEYPPGSLPVFVAPVYLRKIFGYHGTYFFWLRVELLVFGLLALVAMAVALHHLRASKRRAYGALAVAGVVPVVLGPIALFHYDYWAAMFAAAAVAALVARRGVLACMFAAAGAAAKIFPALLIPFALFELWRSGRWRGVGIGAGAALLVLAAAAGPFLVLAPHGLWWAVHVELVRPLEVESFAASLFGMAHVLGGAHLHVVASSGGSHGLTGSAPKIVSDLFGLAMIAVVVAVYVRYVRGSRTAEELVAACAAVVTAYVVFSKVFSPQYLVWLGVLVPLVAGRRGLVASTLLAVILGVTQMWEPYRYAEYFHMSSTWLISLAFVRNLLVLALLGVLALPRPLERHAEKLDPARAPAV